jgi:ankyrin repeat protein
MADTPSIFDCCSRNDVEGLTAIIQSGGDPNAKHNLLGVTPLHFAVGYNSKECLLLLLEAGAEINAKNNDYGWTPLHVSALYGSKDCFQLLLQAGADPNAKDNKGKTPLDCIEEKTFKKEIEEYINALSTLDIKEPSC